MCRHLIAWSGWLFLNIPPCFRGEAVREYYPFRAGWRGGEAPAGNPRTRADAKLAAGSLVTRPQMSAGKWSSWDAWGVGVWASAVLSPQRRAVGPGGLLVLLALEGQPDCCVGFCIWEWSHEIFKCPQMQGGCRLHFSHKIKGKKNTCGKASNIKRVPLVIPQLHCFHHKH